MIRQRILATLIATTALTAASCSGAGAGANDACALVAGHTFSSVNQMECGLGANGAVTRCNWRVQFDATTYSWAHSDVSETGTYSCDGATITATRSGASTTPLLGRVDPQTGQLTWDGATYVAE